jgi:rhamnopyranosyl-N-acetylglucosaminyl-diphospho-decaprenol beta-1,3/1,4-galactofuranosyltransferase
VAARRALEGAAVSAARVAALIVTYNRRELLLESLAAVTAQTRAPDLIVVVDNASSDGTADAVRAAHPEARLVALDRNTGGAGGFTAGLSVALADGADLVWLMDDDTIAEPDALDALLQARDRYEGTPPAVVASRVVWTDGRDHPMNTPRRNPLARRAELHSAAAVGCVPIRSASFVSILIDADECRRRGLPVADYFLWNDDFEYTTRLLRRRPGLLCPASVVMHKTRTFGSTDADPGDRFFFEVRNKVWMLTRSSSLGPVERLLYAASTVRRWMRTFWRSGDRATLRRALRRGLAAGLRHGPRSNDDALAGLAIPPAPAGR